MRHSAKSHNQLLAYCCRYWIWQHPRSTCILSRTATISELWAPFNYCGYRQTCCSLHILHSPMNVYQFLSFGLPHPPEKKKNNSTLCCLDAFGTNVAIVHASPFSHTHTSEINESLASMSVLIYSLRRHANLHIRCSNDLKWKLFDRPLCIQKGKNETITAD